jgi:hypothetical protein
MILARGQSAPLLEKTPIAETIACEYFQSASCSRRMADYSKEHHMPMPRREFFVSTAALAAGGSVAGGVRAARAAEAGASAGTAVVVRPAPTSGLLFSCKYGMTKGGSLEERLAAAKQAGMDGVDFDDAAAVTPEQLRRAAQQTGVFIHNTIDALPKS